MIKNIALFLKFDLQDTELLRRAYVNYQDLSKKENKQLRDALSSLFNGKRLDHTMKELKKLFDQSRPQTVIATTSILEESSETTSASTHTPPVHYDFDNVRDEEPPHTEEGQKGDGDDTSSEEDAEGVAEGATLLVTGYKSEWEGEVEITDATFEFTDLAQENPMAPVDLTADFGNDDALIANQNRNFTMTGLTVEASGDNGEAFLYSWDGSGSQGDDLYFTVSNGETTMTFTVESYLTGADTDVYQTVEALNVGDTIDVAGFLYWYQGANPHITAVTVG